MISVEVTYKLGKIWHKYNDVQCGPSMMDSVDLYPSKPPIDITIDILFYYSKIWTIDITIDNLADRYPFGLDDRYHF